MPDLGMKTRTEYGVEHRREARRKLPLTEAQAGEWYAITDSPAGPWGDTAPDAPGGGTDPVGCVIQVLHQVRGQILVIIWSGAGRAPRRVWLYSPYMVTPVKSVSVSIET